MRILLVIHQFLPDYSSGTEILALHSALELKARGHDVHVMAAIPAAAELSDRERLDRYEFEGLPVTRFKHAHSPMGDQDNVAEQEYDNHLAAGYFETLVDAYQPDLVHFFHLMRLSASIVDVCTKRGIPMVLTATDFWFVCPMCQLSLPDGTMCEGPDPAAANCVRHIAALKMPGVVANVLNRLPDSAYYGVVRMASLAPFRNRGTARLVSALSRRSGFLRDRLNRIDKVLVPTRLMQATLQRHGLDPTHVRYCTYGIRLPHAVARRRQDDGPLRIAVLGLGEHKGAHVLIQAVRMLPRVDLRVRIYGRPSDFPEYVESLRELAGGDPRIEICGSFPNEQIGEVLSGLDVLVVPSLWFENAPLVIYTAQATGCPVIGSDVAGIAELITHGDNGWLFPPGNAERLAAIIAQLSEDRGLIDQYSARARMPKPLARYVDELLAVYGEVCAERVPEA